MNQPFSVGDRVEINPEFLHMISPKGVMTVTAIRKGTNQVIYGPKFKSGWIVSTDKMHEYDSGWFIKAGDDAK